MTTRAIRQLYVITDVSIDEINRQFAILADRLDQMEGWRGTPAFWSPVDMKQNIIYNVSPAIVATDGVNKSQIDAIIAGFGDLTGTTNQITVTGGTGAVHVVTGTVLSLPQNIHTGASPTFANLIITTLITVSRILVNALAAITTAAESWIGPSAAAGIYFKNGNVGRGTTDPTAKVHIGAGTATAGTGPLKFTSGALLTIPETGTLEFYDGRWYITGTAIQRVIDRTGDVVIATTTVANSDVETTLFSAPLSDEAIKVGRVYKMMTSGIAVNASAADDLTFNVYFGGNLIMTFNPAMGQLAAGTPWHCDVDITVRTIGAGGTCAIHAVAMIGGSSSHFSTLGAIDTTEANTLELKVVWDAAKAGNSISIYQGWLELKN